MTLLPLFFAVGFAASTVDAIAGGGGMISLPFLLSLGLPAPLALGTNKLQSLWGTGMAAFSFYRRGLVELGGVWKGLFFSALGAVIGALATQACSSLLLKKLIPFILLFVFAYLVFTPRLGHQDEEPRWRSNSFYFVIGSILGFYDGFLGPGVGGFWVFLLMYLLGYNLLKATAHTKIFNFNTNVMTTLCFAIGGNIDYRIAFFMALGSLLGGRVGAHFAMKKGAQLVRPLFLFMMLAGIITLIYRDDSVDRLFDQALVALILLAIAIAYFWKMRSAKMLPEEV